MGGQPKFKDSTIKSTKLYWIAVKLPIPNGPITEEFKQQLSERYGMERLYDKGKIKRSEKEIAYLYQIGISSKVEYQKIMKDEKIWIGSLRVNANK